MRDTSSLVMWKKGSVEDLNPGLWYLTLYLICCCIFVLYQPVAFAALPALQAGPAAPWGAPSLNS